MKMIKLYLGVMGSGKTIKLGEDYFDAQDESYISNYSVNNVGAYSNTGVIKSRSEGEFACIDYRKKSEFIYKKNFIDEGQFLSSEQVDYIINDTKKDYYIAMLINNYKGEMFEATKKLIQHAGEIEFFTKTCEICGEKEATHHLLTGNKETLEKSEYKSVCYECWKKGNKNEKN